MLFLAHGENWEVTASRKVSELVKKILEEQGDTKEGAVENGTFELHYTPTDSKQKSFKIPLATRSKSPQQQNGVVQSKTSDISRL